MKFCAKLNLSMVATEVFTFGIWNSGSGFHHISASQHWIFKIVSSIIHWVLWEATVHFCWDTLWYWKGGKWALCNYVYDCNSKEGNWWIIEIRQTETKTSTNLDLEKWVCAKLNKTVHSVYQTCKQLKAFHHKIFGPTIPPIGKIKALEKNVHNSANY
jgi:hypothetical protein